MKIINTNNELHIKIGGISTLIGGLFAILIGSTVMTFLFFATSTKLVALFGLIFILPGLYLIFTANTRTFILQKVGTTTVTAKRLLFGKPEQQSFPTDTIRQVVLEAHTEYTQRTTSTDSDSSFNNTSNDRIPQRVGTLSLILSDNSTILIDRAVGETSNNSSSINGIPVGLIFSAIKSVTAKAPLTKEANQIAEFLGLPLSNVGESGSVLDTMQAVFTQATSSPTAPQPTVTATPVAPSQSFLPTPNVAPSPAPAAIPTPIFPAAPIPVQPSTPVIFPTAATVEPQAPQPQSTPYAPPIAPNHTLQPVDTDSPNQQINTPQF